MSYFLKKSRIIVLAAIVLVLILTCTKSPAGTLATPYTDQTQFTSIPFGSHSHWLQPWRAYLETIPATTFLNGIGIVVNNSTNPELIAHMLAKHGFVRARIEISWNSLDFDDETKLVSSKTAEFQVKLLALKKYGIRPLILLNANHGEPGLVKATNRVIVATARAGDREIQVDNVGDLKIGYSGLSNLTEYKAAEVLITNISGNTLSLSKPLPKDISAGTSVKITTLKYRPFSPPNTDDYRKTMAAWQRYLSTVTQFVTATLGTTQGSDKGFDMEIWNELSFGSDFLKINRYYSPPLYNYKEDNIWGDLVKETAHYVESHPQAFQGILFSDGLANTIPWPASSTNPPRITAISKHPYRNRRNYPQSEERSTPINALHQEYKKSGFIPTYSALFPEYFLTALQTETIIRDLGPITSDIYGTKRGRYARVINNVIVPNPIWITEVNINPVEESPDITESRALAVKAKTTARYFCFYLNKGATQVHLYGVADGNKGLGIVQDNFLKYAEQPNILYPTDDTSYTSPALATTARIVNKMKEQIDPNLKTTRPLQVISISDTHNHYQFVGDGSAAFPNLYNRDVFAFLPFQVNSKRFIIPYYVMTRDIMKDLPPEQFTVLLKGIKGEGTSVTAYDPINDKDIPVIVSNKVGESLELILTATDYPYLLTIQEAQ